MRFLIDAHLPPGLRGVFAAAGHDAIHTIDLPERNAARDGVLNEVSMRESRVLVHRQ
jgi:predicted nuclease of predicted toxin-antitoxin system